MEIAAVTTNIREHSRTFAAATLFRAPKSNKADKAIHPTPLARTRAPARTCRCQLCQLPRPARTAAV